MDTLRQVVELVERHANGKPGGMRIDVLNMSMGYYTASSSRMPRTGPLAAVDSAAVVSPWCVQPAMTRQRELYSAAYARSDSLADDPTTARPRHLSRSRQPQWHGRVVQQYRPMGVSPCYAPGAGLLSTMPPFQGGLLPIARTKAAGLRRESLDPNDYGSLDADINEISWASRPCRQHLHSAAPIIAGNIAANYKVVSETVMKTPSGCDSTRRCRGCGRRGDVTGNVSAADLKLHERGLTSDASNCWLEGCSTKPSKDSNPGDGRSRILLSVARVRSQSSVVASDA